MVGLTNITARTNSQRYSLLMPARTASTAPTARPRYARSGLDHGPFDASRFFVRKSTHEVHTVGRTTNDVVTSASPRIAILTTPRHCLRARSQGIPTTPGVTFVRARKSHGAP